MFKFIQFAGIFLVCLQSVFPNCCFGQSKEDPLKVIFETDVGNDIDDALALDLLYKYQDEGKINLLAISNNKNNKHSIPFLDIMNKWYGYPDISLSTVKDGANSEGDARNYAELTLGFKLNGVLAFPSTVKDEQTINSVDMYRELLSKQEDYSVIIISVGFSTNLARLLSSDADEYSALNGEELIAKKVKFLSVMAGNFDPQQGERFVEYNVSKDVNSARSVFDKWPTDIYVSPYELGDSIKYPGSSIANDFTNLNPHPLIVAYEFYNKMPYDRSTWDLTSVLFAVEGDDSTYFNISKPGVVNLDKEGRTFFEEGAGKHFILSTSSSQQTQILNRFLELIRRKPKYK